VEPALLRRRRPSGRRSRLHLVITMGLEPPMQSFAEFMAESYSSNVPLTWNLASRTHATASFTLDSVKVIVSFEQREEGGPWHVLFEVDRGKRPRWRTRLFPSLTACSRRFVSLWECESWTPSCLLRNETGWPASTRRTFSGNRPRWHNWGTTWRGRIESSRTSSLS